MYFCYPIVHDKSQGYLSQNKRSLEDGTTFFPFPKFRLFSQPSLVSHPGETRVPFSCRVIFTRARVSLALLSLRKNGDYSWSTNGTPFTYLGFKSKNFASLLTVVNALSSNFEQTLNKLNFCLFLLYTWTQKKYSFRTKPPRLDRIGYYREYPQGVVSFLSCDKTLET